MGTPYLSEIRIVSFNFAPKGWTMCNGQTLPINQNQPLFALLGNTYGGNGQTTFALPDLRGRVPVGQGSQSTLGQVGGEENHTLTVNEIPAHGHGFQATSATANAVKPGGNMFATNASTPVYGPGSGSLTPMNSAIVANTGGSQPHTNMQPYLALNFIIALQGVFPSRN